MKQTGLLAKQSVWLRSFKNPFAGERTTFSTKVRGMGILVIHKFPNFFSNCFKSLRGEANLLSFGTFKKKTKQTHPALKVERVLEKKRPIGMYGLHHTSYCTSEILNSPKLIDTYSKSFSMGFVFFCKGRHSESGNINGPVTNHFISSVE